MEDFRRHFGEMTDADELKKRSRPVVPPTSKVKQADVLPLRPEIKTDSDGHIDDDLVCRACGYNLRGQLPTGRCPECETAVARSAYGDYLRFSEPEWVERLAQGAQWIIISLFLGIIVLVVGELVMTATLSAFVNTLIALITVATSAIGLIGIWQMTTPDPGGMESERVINSRVIARYLSLVSFVFSAGLVFLDTPTAAMPGQTTGLGVMVSQVVYFILDTVGMLVSVIGIFAFFAYATQLARRIPSGPLARSATIVKWGFLSSLAFMILFRVVISIAPGAAAGVAAGPSSLFIASTIFACSFIIGFLVFGIWSIVLLFMFRNRFRTAAEQARATWAAPPNAPVQSTSS